jgi:hypothetical protein
MLSKPPLQAFARPAAITRAESCEGSERLAFNGLRDIRFHGSGVHMISPFGPRAVFAHVC